MKVRAIRGVCIGVDRHLKVGDSADLPPADVQFLVSIGAVERVPDEPPSSSPADETQDDTSAPASTTNLKPAKAGKEK